MTTIQKVVMQLFRIKAIPYGVPMVVIRASQNVYLECNCMIIINQGQTTATVDQLVIPPNKFLSIPGELFEQMDHRFRVTFTGAGENNLVFVQKVYK